MASLNKHISSIDSEIWRKSGFNTNNAEAAHALVNQEGKQLSLLSAIIRLGLFFFNCKLSLIILIINNNKFFKRGKRYDERCYRIIEVHDKTGVPYTHQDKSEIKRMQQAITCKVSKGK